MYFTSIAIVKRVCLECNIPQRTETADRVLCGRTFTLWDTERAAGRTQRWTNYVFVFYAAVARKTAFHFHRDIRLLWFIHVCAFYPYDIAGAFYFRRRSSVLFRCGATEEHLLLICLSVRLSLSLSPDFPSSLRALCNYILFLSCVTFFTSAYQLHCLLLWTPIGQ